MIKNVICRFLVGRFKNTVSLKPIESFKLSLGFSPSSLNNMSFSTHSSFSTSYQTLGSMQSPSYRVRLTSSMASIYADAGGLQLLDLCVPLHQHVGKLGIWGTG